MAFQTVQVLQKLTQNYKERLVCFGEIAVYWNDILSLDPADFSEC